MSAGPSKICMGKEVVVVWVAVDILCREIRHGSSNGVPARRIENGIATSARSEERGRRAIPFLLAWKARWGGEEIKTEDGLPAACMRSHGSVESLWLSSHPTFKDLVDYGASGIAGEK